MIRVLGGLRTIGDAFDFGSKSKGLCWLSTVPYAGKLPYFFGTKHARVPFRIYRIKKYIYSLCSVGSH